MDAPITPDEAARFYTRQVLQRFEDDYYKQYPPLSDEIVNSWVAQNHETMSFKFIDQINKRAIPSELLVKVMDYYRHKDHPHILSEEDFSEFERLQKEIDFDSPDANLPKLLETQNGTQYVKILSKMANDAILRESEFWQETFPEVSRIFKEKNQSLIDAVPLPTSQACFDVCLEGMLSDLMKYLFGKFAETEGEKVEA